MTDLLPCPFCGGRASLESCLGEHWVECTRCIVGTRLDSNPENPVREWNRRTKAEPVDVPGCDGEAMMKAVDA